MKKAGIFVLEFSEGEVAELLDIIQRQGQASEFYPDYWQKLAQKVQGQVNYQLQNQPFRCAVCGLREKIRKEL